MVLSVVIGRFQIPELTIGHQRLLGTAVNENPAKHLMVLVGSAGKVPSVTNPLPYAVRAAMIKRFVRNNCSSLTTLTVLPLVDQADDTLWMQSVETLVQGYVFAHGMSHATYFSDPEGFIKHVKPKQGKIITLAPRPEHKRATEIRGQLKDNPSLDSGEFRRGVIWATQNQYPMVSPTVDIACIDPSTGMTAMIKKAGEKLWRFPGGFVDLTDASLVDAARRELREETGLHCVSDWKYRGSVKINDWRLRGEAQRGIITTLYQCFHTGPLSDLKAGDDAAEANWLTLRYLDDLDIMPEHRQLLQMQRTV